MFSIADMAVAGAVALLLFGPEQLPKVARRAGQLVRDVQNTSHSFIREMERAADASDRPPDIVAEPNPVYDIVPSPLTAAPSYHETPVPAPAPEAHAAEAHAAEAHAAEAHAAEAHAAEAPPLPPPPTPPAAPA